MCTVHFVYIQYSTCISFWRASSLPATLLVLEVVRPSSCHGVRITAFESPRSCHCAMCIVQLHYRVIFECLRATFQHQKVSTNIIVSTRHICWQKTPIRFLKKTFKKILVAPWCVSFLTVGLFDIVADTRCELIINPRAYVYINPRTVMGKNAPTVIMKYISLS